MSKSELVNEYFEKAKAEAELCETHADKCKAFLSLAEFIMKYTDKVETDVDMELNISIDYGEGDNE